MIYLIASIFFIIAINIRTLKESVALLKIDGVEPVINYMLLCGLLLKGIYIFQLLMPQWLLVILIGTVSLFIVYLLFAAIRNVRGYA